MRSDLDSKAGTAAVNRRRAMAVIAAAGAAGAVVLAGSVVGNAAQRPMRKAAASEFGISGDGRSDQSAAIQAAIDTLAREGGGELVLAQGGVAICRTAPVILDHVSLDLNGGTLQLNLSEGNAVGVRLRSNATLRNGTIVVRSTGTPGLQAGIHAPVCVGPLYGEGGTPDNLSPDEAVSGWTIRDLILSSDKDVDAGQGIGIGAPAIQIVGGAHDGLIENIEVPDSAVMLGGVHLDWGTIGPIHSSDIPANADHYRAGRAYTSHPHDIVVRRIRIGRLTRPLVPDGGSFGIRLSGVHGIQVSDVDIAAVTCAAFLHTAGDLGYEFARPDQRARALRGTRVTDGRVDDGNTAYLIWTDSYADNVGREATQGYRPMLAPIHPTDLLFEGIRGTARDLGRATFGVRVNHQNGGRIVDCVAEGYKRGFYIDEQVDGLTLVRPVALASAEYGISIGHPSRPPRNIVVEDAVTRGNGRAPGDGEVSGIIVTGSDNVEIRGGEAPLDAGQRVAIKVTAEARNTRTDARAPPVSRD